MDRLTNRQNCADSLYGGPCPSYVAYFSSLTMPCRRSTMGGPGDPDSWPILSRA